mmetsp:Transcript_3803/g.10944  ORF Transcript_3803/g.10944 Transcript_3803/m.10944 type:complete len:205 (+) Transcript_3803:2079-2693(+)
MPPLCGWWGIPIGWCMGWCMGKLDERCGCWIGPWPMPPAFCCQLWGPMCEVCSFLIICICCSRRWLNSTTWSFSFTLTWYAMKKAGFCSSSFCHTRVVKPGSMRAWYCRANTTSFLVMYCCRHRSMRFCTYWMSAQLILLCSGPSLFPPWSLPAEPPLFFLPLPSVFTTLPDSTPFWPPLFPPRFEVLPPALSFFPRAILPSAE